MTRLAFNLKEDRLNRGLSLSQMAEQIDISPATLMRAEEGETVWPATQKKIADFHGLKVTVIWPVEERGSR